MNLQPIAVAVVLSLALTACAVQRAQTARDAQVQMVGMSREEVLACMGPPEHRATEGTTDVWSYSSGNGHVETVTRGHSTSHTSGHNTGAHSRGSGSTFGSERTSSKARYCLVNIVLQSGQVERLNYSGPTGGLMSQDEQCAFVVQNCVIKAP